MSLPSAVRGPIKRRLRRAVDRVVQPYVESIRQAAAPTPPVSALSTEAEPAEADSGAATSTQFHMTLHTLRELELERLRGEWKRVLSVGANGSWYFDWFRRSVGDVTEHIGLEAYVPEPDDLPGYVTWIPNTADRMDDVDSGSVDLVFAGQVSEHMWPDELAGFLGEAHRVLRPGGTLSLDSPNRLVTQHLHWSHGEHTVELSVDEIGELLELAGFDVTSVAGMWRCVVNGRVWQLEEALDTPEVLTRRILTGRDQPDESFCWWVNAVRSDREVERKELAAAARRLFDSHWNTRVSRGLFPAVGEPLRLQAGVHDPAGVTLPFPMRAGTWELTLRLTEGTWDSVDELRVTVESPGGHVVHQLELANARRAGDALSWTIDQPTLLFALVARLTLTTHAPISIAFPLEATGS